MDKIIEQIKEYYGKQLQDKRIKIHYNFNM